MPSSNPVLNRPAFEESRSLAGAQPMTLGGTINKTIFLLAVTAGVAALAWNYVLHAPSAAQLLLYGGIFGGLITAMVAIFAPRTVPFTAPLYAVFEGSVIGVLSLIFEAKFPGIALQAVLLTFGIAFAMLAGFQTRLIRVSDTMRSVIVAATGGVALLYFVSFIASWLFHWQMPLIYSSGPIGIVFSIVVIGLAAFNLVIDFQSIEEGVQRGAPKFMEWYGGFAILVTLVWLYIEVLRLLSKLSRNR